MLKNNLWNRVCYSKKVNDLQIFALIIRDIKDNMPAILSRIGDVTFDVETRTVKITGAENIQEIYSILKDLSSLIYANKFYRLYQEGNCHCKGIPTLDIEICLEENLLLESVIYMLDSSKENESTEEGLTTYEIVLQFFKESLKNISKDFLKEMDKINKEFRNHGY